MINDDNPVLLYNNKKIQQLFLIFPAFLLDANLHMHTHTLTQGKGLMHTYWLTCRDGPITRIDLNDWNQDISPVYTNTLYYHPDHNNHKVKL